MIGFCSSVRQLFGLKFSRFALLLKRLQLDSKIDLTTTGFLLEFYVGMCLNSSSSYLRGLKAARIARVLFFFDDVQSFRLFVSGVFCSVLQTCLYFLDIAICNLY